ncbi:MAG: hypothetical protein LAO24_21490 [Acidobacteriia bacterium]|nr:hypothetical protein [Terriglobia bacterium]
MRSRRPLISLTLLLLTLAVLSSSSYAIPAFSRQYGTSCATCHVDFPKLNDFGKAFKDAGFKFPKDDESFLKVPPVMLGAPAQKDLWPHTIFPGTIPGLPPIGLRFNTFFQVVSKNRNDINAANLANPGTFIPRTDFQPGLFSIFMAGNFGSDIAFWVDEDLSVGGSNADGGLGDGYLKFVNVGRFFKLPTDSLSLRIGQFELDLPFSPARSHNLSGWDIFDEANIGAMSSLVPEQNVNNAFAMSSAAQGIEFSGGHTYRGYHYSLAIVNQNTGGNPSSGDTVQPVVGFFSDSNFKDLYGRFSYRFNLERDPASRNEVQAAGATGPRDHTYLNLGSFYFYGRSVQRFQGANGVLTAREPFYRLGGDFSFNYHAFNLYGMYMYGHDKNLTLFPDAETATGFQSGVPATFSGGFLQADYMLAPWVMGIMRYDVVKSSADRINTFGTELSPLSATRNRFTPGVQFLIHANIKAALEYQIRPQQTVFDSDGNRIAKPFRTNSAVADLEFVY